MKILFFPSECTSFSPDTLTEGLGGTETAIIHLSQALHDLGNEVVVASGVEFTKRDKPLYTLKEKALSLENIDVTIVVKGIKGVMQPFRTKKLFLWTGDDWKNPSTFGLGDKRVVAKINGLLAVSEWQANTLSEGSHFPREKIFILRNGVDLSYFEGKPIRKKGRLIYASSPLRGLHLLPPILAKLKEKHPFVELHAFSGLGIYLEKRQQKEDKLLQDYLAEAKKVFDSIKNTEAFHIHPTVSQQKLAKEMMSSQILVYPCIAQETSSMVVLEAQAAGCAIVTTAIAALPESVGKAGILIQGKPGTSQYQEKFIQACDAILSEDALFEELSKNALKQAQGYSWRARAKELMNYL